MGKSKNRVKSYYIQCGRLRHKTTARRFNVWLATGLLRLLENEVRVAAPTAAARTRWEREREDDPGELFLAPKAEPEPSIRTNAEVVDSQYIYANGGEIKVSREERIHFAELRFQLGDLAEQLIGDYLSRKREFDMRAQYGW